jgi:anti-sigma B factor antagonist
VKLTLETASSADSVPVLHCHGQLTCDSDAGGFLQAVAELLPYTHRLVLELSELETIDRTRLGELVIDLMWAQASGCELKLAAPSVQVHQLLELTGLLSVFDTHATVEEAMLSFRQSPMSAKAAACSAA